MFHNPLPNTAWIERYTIMDNVTCGYKIEDWEKYGCVTKIIRIRWSCARFLMWVMRTFSPQCHFILSIASSTVSWYFSARLESIRHIFPDMLLFAAWCRAHFQLPTTSHQPNSSPNFGKFETMMKIKERYQNNNATHNSWCNVTNPCDASYGSGDASQSYWRDAKF